MPSTILSDNGASSGTAGIKTTGSNDGQLALQTTTAGGTATTAITIDTSQNVGIGATSITAFSTARTLEIAGSSTNSAALRLRGGGDTAGTDDAVIYKVNGNTGAVYIRNYANGRIGFWNNNAANVEIQPGGAVTLKGGNDAATGVGITFPATQSASSDANTLDDYEEGTWTPTILGSTTAGTTTYTTQVGRYTKVGRLVTASAYVIWSNATGTGGLLIGGLPFTTQNVTNLYQGVALGWSYNVTTPANTIPMLYISPNSTNITVYGTLVAGGASTQVVVDTAGEFIYTATYLAD